MLNTKRTLLGRVAQQPFLGLLSRAPSQYPKRRLFVRSREVSKPRDWYFKLSHRFEIWQAHRQQCCRSACQISERSDNSKYKSRGCETLRDLTKIRLFGYWDGALVPCHVVKSLQIIWRSGAQSSKWVTWLTDSPAETYRSNNAMTTLKLRPDVVWM